MKKLRVLIEEEQEILREAYKAVLSHEPSVEIVGVGDGSSLANHDKGAVEETLLNTCPDLIVIGTKLVQSNTIAGLEIIRQDFPQIGIILLSAHFDAESIGKLKGLARNTKRGAYLLKGSINTGDELIRVIHDVAEGRVIVDPQVFAGLIQDSDISHSDVSLLTARELEVLGWLAMGYRNTAIAQALCLEPKTVERHISNIFNKLSNGDTNVKHPRVDAVLHYFRATGQLQHNACN